MKVDWPDERPLTRAWHRVFGTVFCCFVVHRESGRSVVSYLRRTLSRLLFLVVELLGIRLLLLRHELPLCVAGEIRDTIVRLAFTPTLAGRRAPSRLHELRSQDGRVTRELQAPRWREQVSKAAITSALLVVDFFVWNLLELKEKQNAVLAG